MAHHLLKLYQATPKHLINLIAVAGLWLSQQAFAGTSERYFGTDGYSPTFFFDLHFGFTTYHSEAVAMNDRSTHTGYTFGGTAGLDNEYTFFMRTDTNTTAFLLNESSIITSWRDSVFRYRFSVFYLGISFSQVEMTVETGGTATVDAFGQGIGGNTGMHIPLFKVGVLYLDIISTSMTTTKDAVVDTNTLGTRTDIDLGAAFNITKRSFDFLWGYRQRTFTLTASEPFTESMWTTYIGFRLAAFF